ncbi:class II glutamine amidotransferase, partial [Acidovorax sp. SRB_24]|uniref:class II glutamine amidotransferase n=1 Tax=Acidovorax sp. SRB_24 TaxID=1962700 RepID=UPI00197B1BDF
LADEDVRVDFSTQTSPTDRVAVIVTAPLTRNEIWQPFGHQELKVFVDGAVYAEAGPALPPDSAAR